MRNLTPKEKLEILSRTTAENVHEIQEQVVSGEISVNPETNRVQARIDLRKMIAAALDQNGISRRQMALRIGIAAQDMSNYLRGSRTIPLRKIEEILWYLQDGNMVANEDYKPNIIKQ